MAGSRTRWRRGGDAGLWLRNRPSRAVTPADPLPDPEDLRRKALSEKAADFDAVRAAVDDAGDFVRGLWVTFVTLGTYLVIAAGSVTHRQLFLETPIKLPLLDVELPLVAFFVIAPWFFVVFHFYLLLQLALLSEKITSYNKILGDVFPGEAAKDEPARNLRRQLPNDILVQYLAGPRGKGERAVRYLLMLVAWATIVIAPLVVLMALQYRFLPYQAEWVTWVHRGALIADLALLWFLWPGVVLGRGEWRLRDRWVPLSIGYVAASPPSLAVLAASCFALTFPREWMDGTKPAQAFHAAMTWPFQGESGKEATAPSMLGVMFGEWAEWPEPGSQFEVAWFIHVPDARRVIPGTLRLANETFVDEEKLKGMEERGKDHGLKPWEGARTLRTGPRNLVAADLRYVNLSRADLRSVTLDDASLAGAQIAGTRLDDAGTSLVNASLDFAQLQGASLVQADLQGASLVEAQLQGASLDFAQLQGASLVEAQLQGASLNRAQLQGASLVQADLQGASLVEAQLQGASLDRAPLQGASLNRAQLQGASLVEAQLQGASLVEAQLQGASLSGAFVFRALASGAVFNPVIAAINADEVDLTDTIVGEWIADATKYVADGYRKSSIDQRLARLKANGVAPGEDAKISAFWAGLSEKLFDAAAFGRKIADLACAGVSSDDFSVQLAPYVARGLIRNGILKAIQDGRVRPNPHA